MGLVNIAGCIVHSPLPLGLPEINTGDPDVELTFPARCENADTPHVLLHRVPALNAKPWLSLTKQGEHYLFRFHDLADFVVLEGGKKIQCFPGRTVPQETVIHLFLDQVMPRVLSQRGGFLLHASAVLAQSGVIALLGAAGQGKSTLAASFCQQGWPAIADDCLVLKEEGNRFVVTPSCSSFRLWPNSIFALFGTQANYPRVAHYTGKQRVPADDKRLSFCTESAPLRRVYALTTPGAADPQCITITELKSREATMRLINAAYRLDITDKERLRREFTDIGRLAATRKIFQLAIPRDHSLLPQVRAAVFKNLEQD